MEKTWVPTVAGILQIIAGVTSLLGSLFLGVLSRMVPGIITGCGSCSFPDIAFLAPHLLLSAFSAKLLILGILALVGGVFAIQRRHWGWAIAGSIAAVFCCFPLGIPAIILTVICEKEFRRDQ